MAQSGREIKRRMNTISSTQQITRAMEMIAASKLRKAQERAFSTRPYFERLESSLRNALRAAHRVGDEIPPIAQPRSGSRHCLVVITSDRGLAGGYNAFVIREALRFMHEHKDTQIIVVGRKARDYFRRRDQDILAEYINLGDNLTPREAHDIGQVINDFYVHDLFDQVTIVYTQFVNTVSHPVQFRQVLPIGGGEEETADSENDTRHQGPDPLYSYEPSIGDVLDVIVPLYIDAAIYQSLIEAKASEFGARMTAMHSATDNAAELIKELTLSFNRARQAVITKEIAEIVGGANALEA